MMRRYTDTEQTGIPAVPRLDSTDDPNRQREAMEETVWSHRLVTEDR